MVMPMEDGDGDVSEMEVEVRLANCKLQQPAACDVRCGYVVEMGGMQMWLRRL